MLNYLELLMDWAERWNRSDVVRPTVDAQMGDASVDKRAAWIVVEGASVAGQMTVWESGECELEAYRVADSAQVLLEHRGLASPEDLESACRAIVTACGWTAE